MPSRQFKQQLSSSIRTIIHQYPAIMAIDSLKVRLLVTRGILGE
jgi:hypothetical protein